MYMVIENDDFDKRLTIFVIMEVPDVGIWVVDARVRKCAARLLHYLGCSLVDFSRTLHSEELLV